ncbi:uncharacterized protein LOC9658416 [Selaginella moellendorffii]|nr:uncharacterized protein LOC9658416 [Selaginella moellendorffii]|eukprot:XP_002974474.2 uncharacterized protein LOC9658416 [Selaginella moellendorffii]
MYGLGLEISPASSAYALAPPPANRIVAACAPGSRAACWRSSLCSISSSHTSRSRSKMKSCAIGSASTSKETNQARECPDHLLVLVHGILSSPSDWKYFKQELKARLGSKFYIHASSVNSYLQTLTGIDMAGKRLADEVSEVVQKHPQLQRISFVAHSLGGLFARYAIGILYLPLQPSKKLMNPSITGLDPVSFITLATPHLGVRGRQQLPFLMGVPVLEKIAAPIAPFIVGRTGRQLFLTDGKASDPPLLLRMATDCEQGQFISALRAFKLRAVYANVSYDHMVGWRTSSIRRESELSKPPRKSLEGYKHVVNVRYCPAIQSDGPSFEDNTAGAKEAAQKQPSSIEAKEYHDILEEEMVRGLQQVSWQKVDVSFHSAIWPFFAHNNIHVKQEWLHYEGAGVVSHVADTLKQQEHGAFLEANL